MSSKTPLRHEFDAPMEMDGADSGVFLVVPFSVPDTYGTKGPLPVIGTIDGFPIRTNLVPFGDGQHMLSIRKEVRNAINKTWTDTVHLVLERDTEPGGLELPADFEQALDRAGLRVQFDALPFTQRKDLAMRIARTKKDEARSQRIEDALEIARTGRKTKQ
ncbi:YdeI/OmpD-associated family protein [Hymenobacter endophyticus]|uniref:YdeI/OmpD-associated family protein n=1 Tax=Hymenobacter endophyticus TaxID=3076335 RepID=A0ABU3TIK3_9BACT|nr:YdeI/OmpD-associated family protein [Hymenobacter endophyticus]MDU0371206.1 YdeI/OmpD-associated family protein [Hymenobacter endophyticus]